jgi:hypothetical protein
MIVCRGVPAHVSARQRACAFALLVVLASVGCVHAPPAGGATANVITYDEIQGSTAANVYEVIAKSHGEWFRDRGRTSINVNTHDRAMVFLGDVEYGIPETLRNMPLGGVEEIRYYPPTDAVARFGSRYGGGVIKIVPRVE